MSGFIDYSAASQRKRETSSKSGEDASTGTALGMGGLGLGEVIDAKEKNGSNGQVSGEEREGEGRHKELTDQGKQHQRESTKSDFVDHSASRNRGGDDLTQSTSLTRSTSTGSRFTEEFTQDAGQEKVEEKEKKGLKSSTLLFKRRSLKSAPTPLLNKTTSRTDTFRSTTSQDSLQSASSRRIPSFATRSNGSISPTLPSSPRSGNTMKLAPIQSGSGTGTRQREKSNPSPTSPVSRNGNFELTPQDRHYICRILTNSQFQREFSALSQIGTLSHYGSPFLPHANGPNSRPAHTRKDEGKGWFSFLSGGPDPLQLKEWENYEWEEGKVEDSPICQYLYWRFLANLPALRTAKESYWTDQIQPFIDSFAERDLSSTKERGEITKRRMLATGITRIIGSYLSTSIRPIGPSAPARPSTRTMHRVDLLVPGSMDSMAKLLFPQQAQPEYNAWVSVVEEKQRGGTWTFRFVSRVLVVSDQPLFHSLRSWQSIQQFASSLSSLDPRNSLNLPLLPYASSSLPASRLAIQTYVRQIVIVLSSPPQHLQDSEILSEARQILETFLLSGKDRIAGSELAEWAKRGEEMDREEEGRMRVWVGMGKRVKSLRTVWVQFRRALIETDELDKTMVLVKKHSAVKAFPKEYRDAEEWAKIWVAYAFHYIFVASANGTEILNILKGFHDLIPYAAVKVGLALVNPTLAIRAIVSLILGQPAGQQSLFQRIWSIIVGAAIKHQKKLIEAYKKKLSRASIGEVLERHVRASYVERQKTKQVAIENDEDIVLTIMRERGSGSDIELVERWHQEFLRSIETKSNVNTKFEDVKNLLAAYYRLRDREQVLAIALEPNTPRLLHASIAVFYDTIYKVANASKLSERVGDIQAFLDDLIKVCLSDKKEPSDFIKLADRHHEKLYYFIHELAKNGGTLLDPLLEWCKSGLSFINSGIPPSSTSSTPYKRAGVDVEALLNSLPSSSASSSPTLSSSHSTSRPTTKESVLAEARHFATWTKYKKAYHDLCLRIDMLEAELPEQDFKSMRLDKERMWQELLAQERDAVKIMTSEASKGKEEKTRTDAGGDLEWAWWSAEELAGAAGQAKVSIALPTDPSSSVKEKEKEPTRKLPRSKSTVSRKSEDFHIVDHSDVPPSLATSGRRSKEDGLEIPAPSVKATKGLIPKYLEQIEAALREAKKNKVK